MKFTFTEKRMESSGDLRAYAEKKIGKLDRFFKTEAEAVVTFKHRAGPLSGRDNHPQQRPVLQGKRTHQRHVRFR